MDKALVVYEPSITQYDYSEYVNPKHYIIAHRFDLRKGWLITVIKQPFNYRLTVSKKDLNSYDDMWCYEHYVDALVAFALWNPTCMEEPLGWIRNPTTGRRRAYDDEGRITREWIYD